MHQAITTVDSLSENVIKDLAEGRCNAVRIPEYYSQSDATAIADAVCKSSMFGYYENAPKIGRVGQAYFEGLASETAAERYRRNSTLWNTQLRECCWPRMLPVDRLRLELDEIWSGGSMLLVLGGLTTFAGLLRVFSEGSGTEIHNDHLEWDATEIDCQSTSLDTQLTANIYLDMPQDGGHVNLWAGHISKERYEKIRNPGSYGVKPSEVGPPDVVYTPAQGTCGYSDRESCIKSSTPEKGVGLRKAALSVIKARIIHCWYGVDPCFFQIGCGDRKPRSLPIPRQPDVRACHLNS